MNLPCKSAIAAGAFCLSLAVASAPANATIIITKASAFQGEIVLIDGAPGDTGGVIFGHTNHTNTSVTYDGLGQTLEVGGSGQSQIVGDDLNRLSYYLTQGALFNDTEFKISGETDTITFTVVDNTGKDWVFDGEDIPSSGFVGFQGIDGQLIRSVSFTVDNGGTFDEFRQLRLTVIPEPASWAMMVAGFGLIGAAMRRRRAITSVAA